MLLAKSTKGNSLGANFMMMGINDLKKSMPKYFDIGMIFLHEMNHGYFGLTDDHEAPTPVSGEKGTGIYGTDFSSWGGKGETVIKVNKYEKELGYPQRAHYESLNGVLFFIKTETKAKQNGKERQIKTVIPVQTD